MRPGQQQQNKRMRGRGRKGPNPLSRSYESNGPDVKIRGTAQHVAEKYSTLARDAAAAGDRVMAENYLQHAEHYGRIVAAAQGTFQLQQDDSDFSDQDEDGDEDGGENGYGNEPAYPQPQPVRAPQERAPQDRNGFDRPQGERNSQPVLRDNREGQPQQRDNGNGNGQPRDGNRDGRLNNRDNRDSNRELRTGNRDANREPGREGRDTNRANFPNRETQGREQQGREAQGREQQGREQQGRENQNREQRERPAPVGLGPQPFLPETVPAVAEAVAPDVRWVEIAREQPQQPAVTAESPREEFRPRGDAPRPEGEPRRRGRPRRVRPDDVVGSYGVNASSGAQGNLAVDAVPVTQAPAYPVTEQHSASEAVTPASMPEARAQVPPAPGVATEPEVKVKRKPGRPRKKRPEDDGPDEGGGGGDHMPAFLLASNG